jgi:hypothetical protein
MYVNLDVTTIRNDDPGNPDMEEPDVQVENIEKVFLAKVGAQPVAALGCNAQHPGSTSAAATENGLRLCYHHCCMARVICRPLASPQVQRPAASSTRCSSSMGSTVVMLTAPRRAAQIPIMLRSKFCSLHGLGERQLMEMGECPYDQVG